jgi:hypothetical protein
VNSIAKTLLPSAVRITRLSIRMRALTAAIGAAIGTAVGTTVRTTVGTTARPVPADHRTGRYLGPLVQHGEGPDTGLGSDNRPAADAGGHPGPFAHHRVH